MEARSCAEIFSLLSEYLNLELPPDACRAIESHLADCPPCIDFVESLRTTIDLCKQYQPGMVPDPLTNQARDQLLEAYKKIVTSRE